MRTTLTTRQATALINGMMLVSVTGLLGVAAACYFQWARPWAALLLVVVAVLLVAGRAICSRLLAIASGDALRMRSILDHVPESLFVKDGEGRFLFVNRTMADLFGRTPEEWIGKLEADMAAGFEEGHRCGASMPDAAALRKTVRLDRESPNARGSGERWFEMVKTPLVDERGLGGDVLGLAMDITARKAEEGVRHREGIGHMAAGVAHDLNNMLSPAVGYADIVLDHLADDSPVRDDLVAVRESARRSARLVNDLLTLARSEPVPGRPVRINEVVLDFIDSPTFHDLQVRRPHVKVDCAVDSSNPCVVGTASCLDHIVLNMVMNAMEAMPETGAITIRTLVDDSPAEVFRDLHGPGPCVQVLVRDTGAGFDAAHLPRIFEPYYATQAAGGRGSGLSLAVIRSMVQALQGHVEMESTPGAGTTLRLYLPYTEACVAGETEPRERQIRNNRILVVDDDEMLCTLTVRILHSLGFDCDAADDGRDALALYRKGDYDLVILDMVMKSGFDGLDIYQAIREICPGQPCVIVSAHSEGARSHEALAQGARTFLQKPFSPNALRRTVSEVLGIPENEMGRSRD